MDILETLFSNRKIYITIITLYIITMIIILLLIWWPDIKSEEIAYYSEYDVRVVNKKMADYYFNKITNSYNEIIEKNMSEEYLEYNNITINDLKLQYNITNYSILSGLETLELGSSTIYSSEVNMPGKKEVVNIIEEYPYKYKITFGSFIGYKKSNIVNNIDGIAITIKSTYQDKEYVEYAIKLKNVDKDYFEINFANSTSIYLTVGNEKYYISNSALSSTDEPVNMGGEINRTLVFPVSVSLQNNIKSIVFKDVDVNGNKKDIVVYL